MAQPRIQLMKKTFPKPTHRFYHIWSEGGRVWFKAPRKNGGTNVYILHIHIYMYVCAICMCIYIYPSCFGYTVTLLSDLPWYPELQFLYSLIEHPPLSLFEFQLIFMKSIVFWINPHWCWWKNAFSSASCRKICGFHPTMLVSSPGFPSFAKSPPCVPAPPSRMPLQ